MTSEDIKKWAEQYGNLGDVHDMMDMVEPHHIITLCLENELLRQALMRVVSFSHEKSRAFATCVNALADAELLWGDSEKL